MPTQILDIAAQRRLAGPSTAEVPALALVNAMAAAGWITDDEADAWIARTSLPAIAEQALASLPADGQRPERRRVLGMTSAERSDPLVAVVAAAAGASSGDVDALFRGAAGG